MDITKEELTGRIAEKLYKIAFFNEDDDNIKTNHRLSALKMLINLLNLEIPETKNFRITLPIEPEKTAGHDNPDAPDVQEPENNDNTPLSQEEETRLERLCTIPENKRTQKQRKEIERLRMRKRLNERKNC
jgi:hypothetical protein